MDEQRSDRITPGSNTKLIAIVAVSSFIGTVAVSVALGTIRLRILDIAVVALSSCRLPHGPDCYKRLLILAVGITFFACAVWAVVLMTFRSKFEQLGTWLFGPSNSGMIAPATLILVVMVMLTTFAIVQRIAERDLRLRCPHCRAFLGREVTARIVIATKNCTSCGKRMIDA
jgi:hypothetical protein